MSSGQSPGDTPAVVRLGAVDRQIRQLQRERAALVAMARAEKKSWQQIAAALGVSRQAAWEAHRAAADTVADIRLRSSLSEDEAMAIAKSATREVRASRSR